MCAYNATVLEAVEEHTGLPFTDVFEAVMYNINLSYVISCAHTPSTCALTLYQHCSDIFVAVISNFQNIREIRKLQDL